MTLFMLIGLIIFGCVAYWAITTFLPATAHKVALLVVGVIILLVLFQSFLPGLAHQRLW